MRGCQIILFWNLCRSLLLLQKKRKTLHTFLCISWIQKVCKETPSCTGIRRDSHGKHLLPRGSLGGWLPPNGRFPLEVILLPLLQVCCTNIWSMSKETHRIKLPICSSRFCIPWFYIPVNHSLMLTGHGTYQLSSRELSWAPDSVCPAIAPVNIKVHIPKRRSKWIRRGSSSCANEASGGFALECTQVGKESFFSVFLWRRRSCIPFCPSGSPYFHPSLIAPNRLSSNLLCCASCLLPHSSFPPRQSPDISPAKTPGVSDGGLD